MKATTLKNAILMIIVALMAAPIAHAGAPSDYGLLLVGFFHGDAIDAEDGETWYGVAEENGNWRATARTIRVGLEFDEIVDQPGEKTGKEVQVLGPPPVFLARGGNLQPRAIETVYSERHSLMSTEPALTFQMRSGRDYELVIRCPEQPEISEDENPAGLIPVPEFEPCPIVLIHNEREQEIARLPFNELGYSRAAVMWAGDLDNDGELDLLMDLSHHYNLSAPTLLLSSEALEGDLVRPVADLALYGC